MRHAGFFIHAREEEKSWTETERERETERETGREGGAALSGEEVRDFYQSLFKDKDGARTEERTERRRGRAGRSGRKGGGAREGGGARGGGGVAESPSDEVSITAPPTGRADGYRLLRCAEQGDVRGLEDVLRRGCDPNFRDQFNWTALMSAAYSGRTQAVRVLLNRGALWRSITDTQGRDACDLARLAGHQDIVTLLEELSVTHISHTPADTAHSRPPPRWCDVCEVNYTDSAHTHSSSTLHQFSLARPPSLPHYCLAPSSVGYRVMLRLGWDPRSGLGPGHVGRRDPVGTVLKSDTAGLGFGPAPRVKVTHFKANDERAVRRAPERRERGTTLGAKARRKTEERRKQWERDFRSSFNIDP